MGVFHDVMSGRIRNAGQYEELLWRSVYPDYDDPSCAGYGSGKVRVNERNANSVPDFFKAVHVISEDIAKLPKKVKRKARIAGRESRDDAPSHPLYWLLHAEPNPQMSSFRYFETGIIHLLTWGNWYSYIQRGAASGRVQALWPICPHLVRLEAPKLGDPADVPYWYKIIDPYTNTEERFYPDEILHVPFFSYDGVQGQSPVRLLMDTLGLAKAQERYAVRFFGNSARISGLVSPDPGSAIGMTKDQASDLEESLKKYTGVNNAGRLAVVRGAIKWQTISMPNDEAQFLESRLHSRIDMFGMLRLAPHKGQDLSNAHFTNIEHSETAHVKDAIQPTSERCEQEFERQLLSEFDKGNVFIHFEIDGQLRGDTAARTTYYQARFNMGSISQNEIREKENEPPFEGGDDRWIQLNMVPLSMARELLTTRNDQKTPPDGAGSTPNDGRSTRNALLEEFQARVRRSYAGIIKDSVGRVMNRPAKDREKSAAAIFRQPLESLAQLFDKAIEEDFLKQYLGALGRRAAMWSGDIQAITNEELDRAVSTFLEKQHEAQPV